MADARITQKITKAIIPVAGLGTRFLPLSKSVPKELWPLVEKPVIQYIVEEAMNSGIKEIIFVLSPDKKRQMVLDYFQNKLSASKKISRAKYKSHFAKSLGELEKISQKVFFSSVIQKEPLGLGHAVWQTRHLAGKEPCALLLADDVVESKTPCLLQLIEIFKECQKPVIALYRVPQESFRFYGMVEGKKLAGRAIQITKTVEKPSKISESPSDLAIVGKYILNPDVFEALKKNQSKLNEDFSISQVIGEMAQQGQKIYGCEFEGKWLECGNKLAWLQSNIHLALKHPEFGPEIKRYMKEL